MGLRTIHEDGMEQMDRWKWGLIKKGWGADVGWRMRRAGALREAWD